jgi:hypothetical protein
MNSQLLFTIIELSFFITGVVMVIVFMGGIEKMKWKRVRIGTMSVSMGIIIFNLMSERTLYAAAVSLIAFIIYFLAVSYNIKHYDR